MISRRSLFGLGAGAVAASVVAVPAVVPGSITMLDGFYSHDGALAEIMATPFPPEFMANIDGAATMRTIVDRMVRAVNDAGID